MNEISKIFDINELKFLNSEKYKEIKPEGEVSIKEAKDFINSLFVDKIDIKSNDNQYDIDLDDKSCFYDDNNNLYRKGNDLIENNKYEINGYRYATDDIGRIDYVEGKLYLKERENRLSIKDTIEDIGKGYEQKGDDRGHIIGDRFNGSNGLENIIPQDANINRIDYKNFENQLADEIKNGKEVYLKNELLYEENSRRPYALLVTYTIDNVENFRIFPNDFKEI